MKIAELQPGDLWFTPQSGVLGWLIAQAEGGTRDPLVKTRWSLGKFEHVGEVVDFNLAGECGLPGVADEYDGTDHFGCTLTDLRTRLAGSAAAVIRPTPALTPAQIAASYALWRKWSGPGWWGNSWAPIWHSDYVPYAWGELLPLATWLNTGRIGWAPKPLWGKYCSLTVAQIRDAIGWNGFIAPRAITPDDICAWPSEIGVQVIED